MSTSINIVIIHRETFKSQATDTDNIQQHRKMLYLYRTFNNRKYSNSPIMIKWRLYSLYISGALHFVLVISIPLHSLWLKVLKIGDGIRNNDIQLLCVDGDTYPCLNRSDGLAYIYWQKRPQDWNDHKYHGHPLLQLFYQEHDLKDIDLCSRSLQLIQRYNVSMPQTCWYCQDIFVR